MSCDRFRGLKKGRKPEVVFPSILCTGEYLPCKMYVQASGSDLIMGTWYNGMPFTVHDQVYVFMNCVYYSVRGTSSR